MNRYIKEDLHYISSLNEIARHNPSHRSEVLLWVISFTVFVLIIWASFAEVDELTKGTGKVIPSKHVQVIQNLDGGVVSDIFVHEGELVEKGQVLVQINDADFLGSYNESHLRYNELQAKALRLKAEASLKPLKLDSNTPAEMLEVMQKEKALNTINLQGLQEQINILEEEYKQSKNALQETLSKEKNLQMSYDVTQEKLAIMKPLLEDAIISHVEYLDMTQQSIDMEGKLDEIRLSIPRLKSSIQAAKKKIEKTKVDFQVKAREEYTRTSSEISRLKESGQVLQNRVDRAEIKSPVRGIINNIIIKTIGGVVQPGMDIMEIVPLDDKLLVEAKIKPSDIAYIYPGQRAKVKFTAYDFTIYGGLFGTVVHVSPDTLQDEDNNNFYLVDIQTDKSYLMRGEKKFDLMVGMMTQVDIITGKKTIMDYLLKPLIKTKEEALSEK